MDPYASSNLSFRRWFAADPEVARQLLVPGSFNHKVLGAGACRPIRAIWDTSAGECAPPDVITSLSYLVSAASVVTYSMKKASKISISIILGIGATASIATIIRLPYIAVYYNPDDYLYNIGNVAIWCIFESGTGIVAGSLPSLRRLLKNWVDFDSSNGHSPEGITPYTGPNTMGVTSKIGSATRSQRFQMSKTATTIARLEEGRDWGGLTMIHQSDRSTSLSRWKCNS
ncbi:hypothetical protein EDB81DRAFT_905451 [Dactylonectria macrodidyma]|uniref:Rhodopsin domain-containing protein n=1 Tax=Dactylonectria macrodidyma TaxID=307937 RepID=A0A9P9E537_9HYPO|nr:hypothetical protein EDB81DRAFT_905451 [Dactylonectria macrodidyma]